MNNEYYIGLTQSFRSITIRILYLTYEILFSTFESIDKRKENKLKKLKLKLDLAKFIQESMVTGITLQNGKPYELEKFSQFIARVSQAIF